MKPMPTSTHAIALCLFAMLLTGPVRAQDSAAVTPPPPRVVPVLVDPKPRPREPAVTYAIAPKRPTEGRVAAKRNAKDNKAGATQTEASAKAKMSEPVKADAPEKAQPNAR